MKRLLKRLKQKFLYALVGLWITVKEEKSLWTHLIITAIVIGMGFYLKLSGIEWGIILLCVFIVIGFEVFNTAIEALVDMVSFQYNIKVKKIKDISAGATLISTIGAVIIGLIIFIPHFQKLAGG